jgi:hypothetical protein
LPFSSLKNDRAHDALRVQARQRHMAKRQRSGKEAETNEAKR